MVKVTKRQKKRRRLPIKEQTSGAKLPESMIDETLAESFPASDPPSWTTGREKSSETSESSDDELARLSMEKLQEKARGLDVPAGDNMNKDQLIRAIRARLSGTEA